jgi:hypothetical protein
MFTRDIEKAFYFLRMEKSAHKWMCFYEPRFGFMTGKVLLFGFGQAVMFFRKICRPILAFLRAMGVKVMNMIDDWLVSEQPKLIAHVQYIVVSVLTSLGWRFNNKGTEPDFTTLFLGLLNRQRELRVQGTLGQNRTCTCNYYHAPYNGIPR